MLFMKIFFYLFFFLFSSHHKILHIDFHLLFIDWPLLTNHVCLYILVYIFLSVKFRAIGRQEKNLNPLFVLCQPLVQFPCLMPRMAIGDKVNFLPAVFYHPLQEGLKHLTVEPTIDDHEL